MKLNIKVPENIDALSKLLSLIAVLVFLHFFFKNLTVLIGQIIQSRTGTHSLAVSLDPSVSNILAGVIAFSALVIVVIFGSSFFLRFGNNEISVNPNFIGVQHIKSGSGGANKLMGPDNSIVLNPDNMRELVRDGILSEVNKDGQLVGYITMESFLNGCYGDDCRLESFFAHPLVKERIYSGIADRAVLGEDLLSVATKMYTNQLSAIPVIDAEGRMIGSINSSRILKLLIEQFKKD
ncbi:CBS domain-containing protein [Desulforamulus aquiferis]|uniref:CBS domain-containing protein n=1 Tax=Desulforamulus aquiferis TaxID=1397668 RepID=A0AAW7ZHV0_9FIRM|nr:CBS domain-containing protein [Desulforamulus aquiferis]MDO7788818.1 CBS domain-containing protein [Desulforamulus aquiferis]